MSNTTPTTSATPPKKGTRPGIAAAARMQARLTELEGQVQHIRALLPEKEREGHLPDLVEKRFSALSTLARNINEAEDRTRQRFGIMPETLNLKQVIDKWETAFQMEYDRAEREIQAAESYRREVTTREATIEGLRTQLKALDQKGQTIRDALPADTQVLSLDEAVVTTIKQMGQEFQSVKKAMDDFYERNGELQNEIQDFKKKVSLLEKASSEWQQKHGNADKRANLWRHRFIRLIASLLTGGTLAFFYYILGGPK